MRLRTFFTSRYTFPYALICGYSLFALASPTTPGAPADPASPPGVVERPATPLTVVQHKPDARDADVAEVN